MATGKLTNTAVKNASFKEKAYKLSDAEGMYLHVQPSGKYWRMDYRYAGKRKTLALGVYPSVTLKEARNRRESARKLLEMGTDPVSAKRRNKHALEEAVANNFELLGREWYEKQSSSWVPAHAKRILERLEKDVYPWLGKRPISDITSRDVLIVLQRIENRGAIETAHRVKGYISSIFQWPCH